MMMKKPVIRHMKNVTIRNISIFDKCGLSTNVTTIKTKRGPQAHHSPHMAAGDATL
jgi:hypothetical protein